MSNLNEALSRNLKIARSYLGWSQKDLAAKLLTSQSTYSQYEVCARLPHVERLVELAQALGQSVDALLGLAPLRQVSDEYFVAPDPSVMPPSLQNAAKAPEGNLAFAADPRKWPGWPNPDKAPKPEKPRKGVVL